tara:strand:+ start:1481 stop:4171 length:2691 start_codon:yes stop_codon:yes gene_type:complete
MKIFFENVVDEIIKKINLETTYFIIPNRRSKVYLKKEILKKTSSVSISPQIYSIDDFIERIADIKEVTRTNQLFYLYESYMKISNKKDFESYILFRNWANTLLNDINDIDMAMAESTEVFNDLYEIQKLQSITDEKIQTSLNFWQIIPKIILEFKSRLNENNMATKGICHINAKENIDIFSQANKDFTFIFLGLNSLSNTEQFIINHLLENNETKIYWDTDESFISNIEHEAGYFFRKYMLDWDYYKRNKFNWINNNFSSSKNIFIYQTTKQIAQAKTAANLIEEISSKKTKQKTAIILPSQNLLIPLINSIPFSIKDLSMSISNPLLNMPLTKFCVNILEMYSRGRKGSFYYKDVINVISNSYFNRSLENHSKSVDFVKSEIINKNIVYISQKNLLQLLKTSKNQNLKDLFSCSESNIIDNIINCLDLFESNIHENSFLEQASKIKSTLLIINNFNSKHKFSISFSSLKDFFFDIVKSQSINFYGDPSFDFHIMGLLESRGMDFDNVIICSANEGILPSNNFYSSLLPFDLRKKYNIPTIVEDDARTSYDFYHLLLRATNIHLIYNSVAEGLDSGEKSRYIHQLEILKNKNHNITEIVSHYPFNPSQPFSERFEKTGSLIKRLYKMSESGFSPSSLNRYIENPINFFDEYILNVKSDEDVNERPEARGIGIIFHNTMETIYSPYDGKKLIEKNLKKDLKNIDKVLDNEFINEYGKNYERGSNIIIYQVLKNTISTLIQSDIKKLRKGIEIEILGIESKLKVDLVTEKSKIKYKLKGTVDRIQSENGIIKIIDYKTGSFQPYRLSFNEYEELVSKKKKEAFQLLCYCLMYSNDIKKQISLNAGIISFKNMNLGLMSLKKSSSVSFNKEELSTFKETLDSIIEEIFDSTIPFLEKQK